MEYICSVCHQSVSRDMMIFKEHTENHIVELVKYDHPDWVEENGICQKCWAYYRDEIESGIFKDVPCALRRRKARHFWKSIQQFLGFKQEEIKHGNS